MFLFNLWKARYGTAAKTSGIKKASIIKRDITPWLKSSYTAPKAKTKMLTVSIFAYCLLISDVYNVTHTPFTYTVAVCRGVVYNLSGEVHSG